MRIDVLWWELGAGAMIEAGYLEMTGYAGRAMSAWFGGEGK
jgi:hypothetical protein